MIKVLAMYEGEDRLIVTTERGDWFAREEPWTDWLERNGLPPATRLDLGRGNTVPEEANDAQ